MYRITESAIDLLQSLLKTLLAKLISGEVRVEV